ncbi:alpha/beta hydrolase family protein [Adhaeribacter radiodurans]|uniref:Prolyl oligopeptidase family serine peptidase n=1 Tax=Adhaeribacter radiodurans TaxID=2745197 RepID=A0A7L7L9E6_9BACT|nr:lipase family protein [Adhaeribacter radiodurans]QMU29472.1 prolyl oligopeptidase family serine peptidase [Adhaeribacter radiodurans]
MKKYTNLVSYWLFVWVLLLAGCQPDDSGDNVTPEPDGSELFVSADAKTTISKTILQGYALTAGYGRFLSAIKYNVAFYKFTYKTTYRDNPIEVSGLLAIPQNTPTPPAILSAQHGTMFANADAPSNFPASFTGFELFAAAGYITLIPDFIGFGVSQNTFHPYYDQKSSASTVVDMIKAAKWYLKSANITANNNLFLVGYSEGGYVTMAAQKEIETNPDHKLTLTAAAAGAGGYDLTGMLTGIATTTTYPNPSFLAFIIQAYNTTYDWKRPLTDFFQEPYATTIPALFDGTKDIDAINQGLTNSPAALFNPAFYAGLQNPTGEQTLKKALTDNSFLTWVPKSPTRLYHGTADEAVFYSTSETTFNRFKAAGATNVEFFPIEGGMHRTSIETMMINALPWLESLNK